MGKWVCGFFYYLFVFPKYTPVFHAKVIPIFIHYYKKTKLMALEFLMLVKNVIIYY